VEAGVEWVDLPGVRIAFRRSGFVGTERVADDVPVVLLHALAEDSSTWDDLRTELTSIGRAAIAIDLRGHGQSSWPGTYTFALMVDDVIGLVNALGIASFDLIGHSLGGHLALCLAGCYPDRVRRIIIEDAPPPPELFVIDVDAPTRPAVPTAFDWGVVALRQLIRTPDLEWWDRLSKVGSPALIIGGGASSQVDQGRLRLVAYTLANGRFVTIEAGHLIHRAEPRRFAELVLETMT
jgi:3-oxoadipate enol-lactonase